MMKMRSCKYETLVCPLCDNFFKVEKQICVKMTTILEQVPSYVICLNCIKNIHEIENPIAIIKRKETYN